MTFHNAQAPGRALVLPMGYSIAQAERVRGAVGGRAGVTEKEMFGGIAFLLGGHMCVGVHGEDLIVRVEPRETAALLRRSGAEVRVGGTEDAVLWEKLARQAPVAAATALTHRPIGELRSDPSWRKRLEDAVVETCRVALADGVELTPEAQWEIIDAMPAGLTSSTARDIAAGRPSELDAITGSAVRAAHRLGVPAPVLESLLEETEAACLAQSH